MRGLLHLLLIAGLVGLLALEAIRARDAPGWLLAAIAGAIGLAAAGVYARVSLHG
jgi:uncharacterized membrane protein YeaQ/YmgE (transglycosylase-associated protein family)